MVKHIKDYPTANTDPWQFPHHNAKTREMIEQNPVISKHYNYSEATQHFYIKDKDQPYIQEKPFDWIRGYQVGGERDNIDSLPDSEVVGAFEMNVVEKYIKEKINTHFKDRHVIIGRCANLAELRISPSAGTYEMSGTLPLSSEDVPLAVTSVPMLLRCLLRRRPVI
ncbi:hypothetical protein FQR65_LT17579 [Abscondita terminalis]|nr:hypothetical protein FQR65_LT17579 [Abscondita terminalis]